MNRRLLRLGALVAGASVAGPAWACTLCHSQTGEAVRAAVFGSDFWANVGTLALPVPVLVGAVLLVRGVSP